MGCPVPWGNHDACGEYLEYRGGVQYRGGYHEHRGGVILSTVGDTQYRGEYHEYRGGYLEYCGGYSVLWRIMMHVGDVMSTVGCSVLWRIS